jgi:uncharacterized protein (DUF2141 family)
LDNDSLGLIHFKIERDAKDPRRLSISAPWTPQKKYNLVFLPGAITDFWNRENDTVKTTISIIGNDQFGDMNLTVDGLDSTKQYLVYIKEGEQIRDTFVLQHQQGGHLTKKGLLPGKYTIEMIEDLNNNGVWDTGNYNLGRQPERKMIFIPDLLRAGWELEVKLTWLADQ